jgi:arginine decarboxylase
MNHNLLGSVNEAHFLLDDAGRPHLDKVIRGESLNQVLASAGYEMQSMVDGFRHVLNSAQVQARVTAEDRESLMDSFRSTLDSYTYLED